MENTLFLDLETRSALDIKKVGSYKYAENCDILLFAYAMNDDDVEVIEYNDNAKSMIQELINSATTLVAHNSMFDRIVLDRKRFKGVDISKWHDTMVQAMIHSLPASLEGLGAYVGLEGETAKDIKNGKDLIRFFSTPVKNKKGQKGINFNSPVTDPSKWNMFKEYAKRDVEAMRECYKRMPKCNNSEFDLWRLDQAINDRGVHIDTDFVQKIIKLTQDKKAELDKETQLITDNTINSTNQVKATLDYIYDNFGIKIEDGKKGTIEAFLDENDDLPVEVVDLLVNRCLAGNTTVKKYETMQLACCEDGTLKGMLKYAGATRTGRWSGQLVQPQNLPRPHLDYQDTDTLIELVKQDALHLYTNDVINVASSCIRGAFIPAEGKQLVVSDLSSIEGRVLAWLAGETWVLNAYKEYDCGIGRDMYVRTYSNAFKVKQEEVNKYQRQVGKVMELGLGYQGGVGAFVNFANVYNLNLDELAVIALPSIPHEVLEKAKNNYQWHIDNNRYVGLVYKTWIVIDALKTMWRNSHKKTQALWYDTERAVKNAIQLKGQVFEINSKLKVLCSEKGLLRIRLPSGRYLCYPNAHLNNKQEIVYEGINQKNRKWANINSYSGKLVENCIAEYTLVVTNKGLKAIQHITKNDLIWDGVKFVAHNGLVSKGEQKVIEAHGVVMTPDHKVLTEGGWKNASQSTGFNRAKAGLPYSIEMESFGRQKIDLDSGEGFNNTANVYDILNCGDLQRFVVIDKNGEPLIVHNCTQAVARDILASMMPAIENNGFEILLTVHDEVITQAPIDNIHNEKLLSQLMSVPPEWASDLPLAAEGFESLRYKKD